MFKCLECSHLFEVGEEKAIRETHGFTDGTGEIFKVCPVCGGDFEEAVRCSICGEYHFEDDLQGGVCADCLTDVTLDDCLAVNGDKKTEININSVLAYAFTESQIEEILMRELRQADKIKPVSCLDYINEDITWFAEELAKIRKAVK